MEMNEVDGDVEDSRLGVGYRFSGYSNGEFEILEERRKKMFETREEIEAILGKGIEWVDEEDSSDITFLMDKLIREGLTEEEQTELNALQGLYMLE